MKKLLSLVLAFVMLFTLVSCVNNDPNKDHKQTTLFYYPALSGMTETPTRILYTLNDTLYYYNKIEEESYVFCFDPLCHHDNYKECISLRFIMNGTNSVIRYCEENNRFYALRGQKLFSFSFDGSDLKEEYSFGEDGALDSLFYDSSSSMDLNIFENHVYFITFDIERGTRNLMHLDINTGKTENLSAHLTEKLVSYLIVDGAFYLTLQNGKESGVYRADMNLENMTKLSDSIHPSMTYASVWNGKQYFYINYENQGNKNVPVSIMAYAPESDTTTKIFEITDGIVPTILAASETELYFIKSEPTAFGTETVRDKEQEVYNAFSKVYKLSIADGVCETVMNDLSCEASKLYFLDDNKVLILGQHCEGGEGTASKMAELFMADIGEDGSFANVRTLEEKEPHFENLGYQTESSTKYPPATIPVISENLEQKEEVTWITDDIVACFKEFLPFPSDGSLYHKKSKIYAGGNPNSVRYNIKFVVVGIEPWEEDSFHNMSVYRIKITEAYGYSEEWDPNKIYRLVFLGTPTKQLLDRPAMQVGKEYIRFGRIKLETETIQASLVAPVEVIDGVEYVYGYGFDFSELSCAIPITDEKENQILKEGIHDKHIAYAKEHGITLPTFDYKCEVDAIMRELGALKTTADSAPYQDTFESFMKFPGDKGYFFGKVAFERYETEGCSIVFFRVIGMEEEYVGDFMIYLVQIVDIYGVKNYNTEKIYRMAWRGHLEDQLYGRPPLEIGKTYGRLMALNEGDLEIYNLWQAGLIYDVKEENGKRYLYAYGTDLSIYNCKIPITDSEENSIYKQGKHDKAIAKLKELGQSLPTFDYKVEAETFYEELN